MLENISREGGASKKSNYTDRLRSIKKEVIRMKRSERKSIRITLAICLIGLMTIFAASSYAQAKTIRYKMGA